MGKTRSRIIMTIWLLIMSVVAIIMLYPFIYSALAGLNHKDDFGHLGSLLPMPKRIVLSNFLYIFTPNGIRPLINTVFRTAWYTVNVCLMAVLVGYVMARYEFKGKKFFLR